MQRLKVADLKDHPRNGDFFEDITGEKWTEFVESIKASNGPIEPIVVTEDMTIVSGHQRVRACRELGIDEVWGDVHVYKGNDAEIVKDLIETNVRQRGVVGGTDEQIVARVDALKQYYGVSRGVRGKLKSEQTAETVEGKAGVTHDAYKYAKASVALEPEVKTLVESGVLTKDAAIRLLAKLSPDEQLEVARHLDTTTKYSREKLKEYIAQLDAKSNDIAILIKEKQEAQQVAEEWRVEAVEAKRTLDASEDGRRYILMKQKCDDAVENYRREHENYEKYKKQASADLGKEKRRADAEQEANRSLREKLVATEEELEQLKHDGLLEVEVPPADYKEIKEKLKQYEEQERQKQERANSRTKGGANRFIDWIEQVAGNAEEAMRGIHMVNPDLMDDEGLDVLRENVDHCITYFEAFRAHLRKQELKEVTA